MNKNTTINATAKRQAKQAATINAHTAHLAATATAKRKQAATAKVTRKQAATANGYSSPLAGRYAEYATANDQGKAEIGDLLLAEASKAAYISIRKSLVGATHTDKATGAVDGLLSGASTMSRQLMHGVASGLTATQRKAQETIATADRTAQAYAQAVAVELTATDTATAHTAHAATQAALATAKQAQAVAVDAVQAYATATANDTDDLTQVAALAMWGAMVDGVEDSILLVGIRAVHKAMSVEDGNTSVRIRRTYDDNGNIIHAGEYQYTKYGHMYIDVEDTSDVVDVNDGLARLIAQQDTEDLLHAILAKLGDKELRILHLLAAGNAVETVARKVNLDRSNVWRTMQSIRKTAQAVAREYDNV